MSRHDLIQQLAELHEALPAQSPEESQHRLLIAEIMENLESQDMGTNNFDQFSDTADTINMLLIRYEDKHPAVAGILRSLSNTLAGMGI